MDELQIINAISEVSTNVVLLYLLVMQIKRFDSFQVQAMNDLKEAKRQHIEDMKELFRQTHSAQFVSLERYKTNGDRDKSG